MKIIELLKRKKKLSKNDLLNSFLKPIEKKTYSTGAVEYVYNGRLKYNVDLSTIFNNNDRKSVKIKFNDKEFSNYSSVHLGYCVIYFEISEIYDNTFSICAERYGLAYSHIDKNELEVQSGNMEIELNLSTRFNYVSDLDNFFNSIKDSIKVSIMTNMRSQLLIKNRILNYEKCINAFNEKFDNTTLIDIFSHVSDITNTPLINRDKGKITIEFKHDGLVCSDNKNWSYLLNDKNTNIMYELMESSNRIKLMSDEIKINTSIQLLSNSIVLNIELVDNLNKFTMSNSNTLYGSTSSMYFNRGI